MRIGGQWVGLGLGDASDEIRAIKRHMRGKFSYARDLKDTGLFDEQMHAAVVDMQSLYNAAGKLATGKYTAGIINVETKVVMGFIARPVAPDTRPLLFTVCGTGVPWWIGPDADTARAVENIYRWQPIGYPAKPVPMGPSIRAGRDELYVQILRHREQITRHGCAFAGYSQGAIVVSETWEFDIKPDAGRLAWLLPHVRKAVTWGNPMRERGRVWPNGTNAPSPRGNGGVTEPLMVDTPTWWREYANRGDLYTDSPDDESGENRTAIWKLIRDGSIARGPNSLLRQLLEVGGLAQDASQIAEMTGLLKAMLDAMIFFGQQTRPHLTYSTAEAIDYLRAA